MTDAGQSDIRSLALRRLPIGDNAPEYLAGARGHDRLTVKIAPVNPFFSRVKQAAVHENHRRRQARS